MSKKTQEVCHFDLKLPFQGQFAYFQVYFKVLKT